MLGWQLTLWLSSRRDQTPGQRCLWADAGWVRFAGRCGFAPPPSADRPGDSPLGWDGTLEAAGFVPGKWETKDALCCPSVQRICSQSNSPLGWVRGRSFLDFLFAIISQAFKIPANEKVWLCIGVCESLSEFEHSHTHTGWGATCQDTMASRCACLCVRVCVCVVTHGCCLKAAIKLSDTPVLSSIYMCNTSLSQSVCVAGHTVKAHDADKQPSAEVALRHTLEGPPACFCRPYRVNNAPCWPVGKVLCWAPPPSTSSPPSSGQSRYGCQLSQS